MATDDSFADFSRRQVLAGLAATSLVPRTALAAPAASVPPLKTLLDEIAAERDSGRMSHARGAFNRPALSHGEAAIHRMVVRGIAREADLRRVFPWGKRDGSSPYVLSQRHGVYLELASGRNVDDAALRINRETEQLAAEAARGVAPPTFIIDAVLEAQVGMLRRAPSAIEPSPDIRAALMQQVSALQEIRRGASPTPGVWRLPGGSEYFALRLRRTSGRDQEPAELDRQIAADTGSLLARADRLLRGLGLVRGTVGARLRALGLQRRYLYANSDADRDRAIADMNASLERVRPHLPIWFNPPLEPGSGVRRMSPAEEQGAKRGYRSPASGGVPGAYYPDFSAIADRPRWTLATVAHHETIPGHLLQLGHQARVQPHPLQLEFAAGYPEGWAIYAESLVDASGLFSVPEQLGFIQSLLFRLARVTSDIGIHVHRWDRARALRYLADTVGFELFFPFAVEVDRYAAEPAAFAGDAVVALALRRLGGRARRAGSADLRRFHDAVLGLGPLSADALESVASVSAPPAAPG